MVRTSPTTAVLNDAAFWLLSTCCACISRHTVDATSLCFFDKASVVRLTHAMRSAMRSCLQEDSRWRAFGVAMDRLGVSLLNTRNATQQIAILLQCSVGDYFQQQQNVALEKGLSSIQVCPWSILVLAWNFPFAQAYADLCTATSAIDQEIPC